ncbi:MAG TPA: FliH/SctL family protein [Candidatus Baltobacteraceae bacterium]|jgi:flagellar assembly protein FliH|nr:FliH/SctL family protein [Candidatus Baltobacteraceae bacterium]
MGKIVKGAKLAQQAYQVKPPPPPRVVRPLPSTDDFAPAGDGFADLQPPHVPQVDLEAIHAEAAQLIDDASADAQKLIRDAQERAVALLEDAQRRAGDIEAEAKQQGFEQGASDGRNAAAAEMDEMLETMRGLVEMARVERHKIIETAEPEIVRLAVFIAERVLSAHVAVEKNAVLEMVRSAITRLVNREKVTVRVNPSDIETMRAHRDQLMQMNDIDNLRVIEDQRVDRGGVVIETDAGTIDSKVSTQLREVRRLLAVDDPVSVAPSNEPAIINPPAQAS